MFKPKIALLSSVNIIFAGSGLVHNYSDMSNHCIDIDRSLINTIMTLIIVCFIWLSKFDRSVISCELLVELRIVHIMIFSRSYRISDGVYLERIYNSRDDPLWRASHLEMVIRWVL